MLPIPRVNSFLGFDLKNALLCIQFIGIAFTFFETVEYFIKTKSLESIVILMVFNLLPLLSACACIYGIVKNKPKFMLPDLIGGSFVIFILIVSILVIPEIVIAYIEETGLLATQKGVIILRITFFTWIFLSIFTGAVTYYMIALYSLYMGLTEGGFNLARDRNFVLNMDHQANIA